LADARRPEPHRIELGERLLDRDPKLPFYDRSRYLDGHGRHLVLELLELGEDTLGDDIRAGAQ
jgi:hypothetical protein